MGNRQIILLVVSIFIVVIFFNIPTYRGWLDNRILVFTKDIHEELSMTSYEDRRIYRLQGPYTSILSIKENAKLLKIDSPVVLFPPKEYYQKLMPGLVLPEPVICYYYAGLRVTTPASEDLYSANCCVIFEQGQFVLSPLSNREQIEHAIAIYKSVK